MVTSPGAVAAPGTAPALRQRGRREGQQRWGPRGGGSALERRENPWGETRGKPMENDGVNLPNWGIYHAKWWFNKV